MRVEIDRGNCGGCQLCVDACPDVFEMRNGEPILLVDIVPHRVRGDCRYASAICPTQSIKIVEVGGLL